METQEIAENFQIMNHCLYSKEKTLDFIDIVIFILEKILKNCKKNKNILISSFDANSKPKISIKEYLIHLNRYINFSNEELILALIYLDKIVQDKKIAISFSNFFK